ncbi:MAG: N-formylglutamate amidohydrolase [Gammaproteobacteria bacterium]|nr:N-formylglutamate amidohydrolase [Gammaproteobacteria bacterium]NNC98318.1 N-formylglutamate amidohydrolase [Gammaproteobacteria bacterium]NNM13376.1 N-formylglutamate amidohydrolase [Gammaproteobacteria bacterium]
MSISKQQEITQGISILQAHELPPYECVHFDNKPIVLCCEHASNKIPEQLNNLGLGEDFLETHIALDIGAGELCKRVASQLGATAVYCNYSRLVVDCNRNLKDPTAFIPVSDHIIIPGNQNLDQNSQQQRADAIYHPYHAKMAEELAKHVHDGKTPVLIAIHSFTPSLIDQAPRPWHVGILWDKDPRIPEMLLSELQAEEGIIVGDNQPYSGKHFADYSMDHHAEKQGFAHVCIEVRQDLLQTEEGIQEWSLRLGRILNKVLQDKRHYHKLESDSSE